MSGAISREVSYKDLKEMPNIARGVFAVVAAAAAAASARASNCAALTAEQATARVAVRVAARVAARVACADAALLYRRTSSMHSATAAAG